MSSKVKTRWLIVPILLLSFQLGKAEPFGEYQFFLGEEQPLFDLTGSYEFHQELVSKGGQRVDVFIPVSIAHDADGKLRGEGITIIDIGNDVVAGEYVLNGKVSSSRHAPRVRIKIQVTGLGEIAGVFTEYTITARYNLAIDEDADLIGIAKGTLRIAEMGTGRIHSEFLHPAATDGDWLLSMDVLPMKNLVGSAAVILPGRALPMALSGSYSPRSDVSRIRLTGFDEGRGARLNVRGAGSADDFFLFSVRGKVLGQTVRIP